MPTFRYGMRRVLTRPRSIRTVSPVASAASVMLRVRRAALVSVGDTGGDLPGVMPKGRALEVADDPLEASFRGGLYHSLTPEGLTRRLATARPVHSSEPGARFPPVAVLGRTLGRASHRITGLTLARRRDTATRDAQRR
ncbi:exported hypothetical protein [uncultured Microbacterium sp.]|uniref:Uncharacterized protein n=1 Tax=uncultured Microbacterium sp. TaxID=191216 RepID=A0A1Y5P4B5_9MICO|nr:exported hypothetical protein [uncultured Microbacterium sp.]